MILLMKCISSFTPQSYYALSKKTLEKNIYYGICISFGQADSGLLGNPLGRQPLSLPTGPHKTICDSDKMWTPIIEKKGSKEKGATSIIFRIEEGSSSEITKVFRRYRVLLQLSYSWSLGSKINSFIHSANVSGVPSLWEKMLLKECWSTFILQI